MRRTHKIAPGNWIAPFSLAEGPEKHSTPVKDPVRGRFPAFILDKRESGCSSRIWK